MAIFVMQTRGLRSNLSTRYPSDISLAAASSIDLPHWENLEGRFRPASQGDTICRIPQTPKAISRF